MEIVINKEIGIGDAGLPFDVTIDVTFEQVGKVIIVSDWLERESPYDNPSELWFERMKEVIQDYFFDQYPECPEATVIFKLS